MDKRHKRRKNEERTGNNINQLNYNNKLFLGQSDKILWQIEWYK